jgi:RNA polymerase sigma factor (sigma-70 family)
LKDENIYEEYAQSVFKYLFSLTRNIDLSEELTQETFYQAVKSIDRYNGQCKMYVWLCQIAKHSYYKYLDKHKKHAHLSADTIAEEVYAQGTIEEDVLKKSSIISLYKEIHKLDEPYKEVLLLRVSGELSFKEIGEILGHSESWARVTFYRAKVKIQERRKKDESLQCD